MRFSLFFLLAGLAAATSVGPPKGSVVVVGGGALGPDVLNRFIDLAGGPEAPIVLIPTANGIDPEPANLGEENILRKAGMKHITILHTTDRRTANSKECVAPLRNTRGVRIAGGRQWHLADSYLNTRTVRELRALLPRGGVIGRQLGRREHPQLLRGAGRPLRQHDHDGARLRAGIRISARCRHRPAPAHAKAPERPAAVVVQVDRFEVAGPSKVAIYESGKPYYFLSAGDRFDMKSRSRVQ